MEESFPAHEKISLNLAKFNEVMKPFYAILQELDGITFSREILEPAGFVFILTFHFLKTNYVFMC